MTETERIPECVVVGGGLLGMLTARALRQAGVSVVLLERGATCRESSWAGGGIISPLVPWQYPGAVSRLVRWSQQYYPVLAGELQAETGIDIQWIQSGLMMIDVREDSVIDAWASQYQCRLQRLDAAGTQAQEPALADGLGASLLLPDVAQIRNPRLCKALRKSLEIHGVKVFENAEVDGVIVRAGAVQGVSTVQGDFNAKRVVIAGGAWSAPLLHETGLDLPVKPVRGQMILFGARPGLLKHIVLYQDHYLIPRIDGHILAGSTLEYTGYDNSITPEARDLLTGRALRLVPALADYEVVRHWAGLRPGSPDGVPFIGEHPEIRGLFVNTGHFRNGVVMGPASARLLVDRMLEQASFTGCAPYVIDR